jgi:hypothetical protein
MPASILASVVLARSAVMLNDPTQARFTNTVLLPYLQIAFDDLMLEFQENNVEVTNETSAVITIPINATPGTPVVLTQTSSPAYPADLIDIQKISERLSGTTNDFLPMTNKEFLPETSVLTNELSWYTWSQQQLSFIGALTVRDILINYVGYSLISPVAANTPITLFQSIVYLAPRTAAYAADLIGNNPTRAASCAAAAQRALDSLLSISAKGKQNIATRRRPFRAGYKNRGIA